MYTEDGIWFLRAQNIRPLKLDFSNKVYVSKPDSLKLIDNKIKYSDILITRTGANFGQTAIYNIDKEALGSSHTLILRNNYFNQYYLAVFFNTLYGRKMINKGVYGGLQPEISPYYILNIIIPEFSKHFQYSIEKQYIESGKYINLSYNYYKQAEELLLKELGLDDFNPISQTSSIKSLKDSFYTTGRLDSEYYQTKYDKYLNKIYTYSCGYDLLAKCCKLKDKNYIPKSDKLYKYIELSDIKSNLDISAEDIISGKYLPTRARRKVVKGDVLISSIEGSLNICGLINDNADNILCSTGFYIINSNKINSESLLVLFKSNLMFNLMKKGCSGTILTNITKDEFLKLPIPILNKQIQLDIAEYVSKSLYCLNQSKLLLNNSIQAVEIAIEHGENEANNFLNQINELQKL